MKKPGNRNSLLDKIIFSLLAGLLVLLLTFPLLFKLFPGLEEHSDTDFENEMLAKAYVASVNKSYDQEIYYYNQIVERLPELSPELSAKIGNAYEKKGDYFKAVEFYNRALNQKYSDSLQVYYNVGVVAHHLKNYKMAEKYYKKSCSDDFYRADACFNLANISNFGYEDESSALRYYQNAVEMPSSYRLWKEMLHREMQNYSERLNPEIYANLQDLNKNEKDDIDFSKYDLKELLRNQWGENQALIHNYIGVIYALNQQNELAVDQFQKAISIDPEFKDAKYNLQKVLVATAKKE